jgi:hypothetical protein
VQDDGAPAGTARASPTTSVLGGAGAARVRLAAAALRVFDSSRLQGPRAPVPWSSMLRWPAVSGMLGTSVNATVDVPQQPAICAITADWAARSPSVEVAPKAPPASAAPSPDRFDHPVLLELTEDLAEVSVADARRRIADLCDRELVGER